MTITPLPTAPSTSDPTTFETRMDALIAALPQFITEANALGTSLFLVLRNYISGLTLSAAGSTATFGIAAGQAADSTNAVLMNFLSAFTKTASAFAAGTGNGSLDTGAIANSTWYHVFLIAKADGTVDILASTSVSSPSMPSGYTYKRRIGSMKTNGSAQWYKFKQLGDTVLWDVPFGDISTTSLDTTAVSSALNTPPGVQTIAKIRGRAAHASAGTVLLVSALDEATAVADAVLGNGTATTQVTNNPVSFAADVRTDTSSQIRLVSSASSTTVRAATIGYVDPRGKDG